ncbi:hypothetical protein GCM10007094_39950 [Pseudovibrio japonicus]|uniref:Uncharacterized protein n=1 Tax=Pseudovibrio japonicus TaxID=366534 RepID=A0ABQ3EP77_9HYPH|nr:hypothetical protein [Pseudovibrio japonicus]GHB46645.1 hypothetical protein GCM10007094_39950 [Pseudovibrio japonicus]
MPKIPYVYRRRAVYWWQRRLPVRANTISQKNFRIRHCLHEIRASVAKTVAFELTAYSEKVFWEYKMGAIDHLEVRELIKKNSE